MSSKENVVWCDFDPPYNWDFIKGLDDATGIHWKKIACINDNKYNTIKDLRRYCVYFIFSLIQFIKRKNNSNIIAWQQFYGIIFSFFCRLFHVKKTFNLYIMIFIYMPKKGALGKIYQKFISYAVNSIYIDRIFVFSSAESKKYEKELGTDKGKFVFLPFGDNIEPTNDKCNLEENCIFSSGFSNRDFDFLENILCDEPYKTYIFGYDDYVKGNVTVSSEIVGDKISDCLEKSRIVVVPLKENRESGQFTIIHAMEAGVPVIATDTDCMKDYVIDGVNGYLCPNIKDLWLEKIQLLYTDENLYNSMSENCRQIYNERHTLLALGKNMGRKIADELR